jgi:exopolysaccharide production protein ExoZ
MQKNREINLDILRGLMSCGIMLYHYLFWHKFPKDYSLFINKIGLYGVSVFYILSGITFFLVYKNVNFRVLKNLKNFWIKRFFRIFPLFWVVCFVTVIVTKTPVNFERILLNITGLFSIINPNAALCTGGWSIGNELFFYLLFPVFLLSFQLKRLYFWILLVISTIIFGYFAFNVISEKNNLETQWNEYVNPLNQMLFFVAGIGLGFLYKNFKIPQIYCFIMATLLCLVFVWYPNESKQPIALVSNFNRVLLSIICLTFTYFFIQIKIPDNGISKKLSILGEISYSIYLVHPLVYFASNPIFRLMSNFISVPAPVRICLLVTVSLTICWFIYHYFEKRFVQMGNEIVNKNNKILAQ